MAILPEEFPVVLDRLPGAGRLAHLASAGAHAAIPAIETLGAATVLCVDKTGTLTHEPDDGAPASRRRRPFDVSRRAPATPLPETFHAAGRVRDPGQPAAIRSIRWSGRSHDLGDGDLAGTEHLHADWTLVREYPLSPDLLAMSQVWQSPGGTDYVVAAKGAPEAIADLVPPGPRGRRQPLARTVAAMAADGPARARRRARDVRRRALPDEQHDFAFEFLGPRRARRSAAPGGAGRRSRECHAAGIRVVMITGDYPATARSIARQIGLDGRASES